ncbi:serine/arginine repetitive matrix protein 4 isoform X2 [Silurus meridionalis]|uniref:serine/arginine repetitive matrix protein 4 isoform X2 n=1 Tax=Silurus meridionalis TaxID=175797 RepID=UPI001EEBFA0A|nr:serine/arginine repetitive matrix protein 4 isoform X2 [Silurus meridionalis]
MASLLQGEKQLFDKFWRGTFKAVATPRPESVIIASIAARRETNRLETSVCVAAKPSETPPEREKQELKETEKKRHRKHRGRKRHRRRHSCHSASLDADFSPRLATKAKKKKKKSVRKRRRERCHSSSPSPLRKKKMKKKSSKKRKHHRVASMKTRHSSSSSRRKLKENRKQKKRSRSDSHHRHPSRREESSDWRSSSTARCEDGSKSGFRRSSRRSGERRGFEWCSAVKLATKIPSKCTVVHSRPELEPSHVQDAACAQGKGRADYDSGHDTSSPPSSKTGVSRAQVTVEGQEKVKFLDNSSDSGNSLSSYRSLGKADCRQRRSNTSVFNDLKRSYSRSSSYSCDSSSRRSGKHSRYTAERLRERRRSWSSCEKPSKRSRTRSRRRTCSPMRKRRRDSPSHLEARRITSARKRPIPYYRPSPSSSSRSSSLSSWSLFSLTRSQSRSPSHSRSRSRSRSSYRSYSRSSSLSSVYSSKSYGSLASYSHARR